MRRSRTFLVTAAALLFGCSRAIVEQDPNVAHARKCVHEFQALRGREAPNEELIRKWGAGDKGAIVQGLTALLRDPAADVRTDSAYLLGYMGDTEGRSALAAALTDSNEHVRLAACVALGWLKPGDAAETALATARRDDSSTDVRVAAALALGRNDDKDAVAAFRLGLESKDEYLRERCESALEEVGKLELPLPDRVYEEIGWNEFQRWLQNNQIERRSTKNGRIYFEIEERVGVAPPPGATCALGRKRFWYWTREE